MLSYIFKLSMGSFLKVIPPGLDFSSVIVPDAVETLDGEHDLTMAAAMAMALISLILLLRGQMNQVAKL